MSVRSCPGTGFEQRKRGKEQDRRLKECAAERKGEAGGSSFALILLSLYSHLL